MARTPDEAAAIAARLAGPVALKIVSADIAHKSDAGGVALNIAPGEVAARARAMIEAVSMARPRARIDGVLVGPM
ncbi:acetate--CoA ligase family protein, partial [Escherichia coli]|uniref:acetate--CoA ligase family protein n=1 Tax=Escherichia coli TaxID=562 RepID=UPI001954A9FB